MHTSTRSRLPADYAFRWSWQNTHLTRHIPKEDRITQASNGIRISPKTGKARKKPLKPRGSLSDKIANLHLLLRTNSFARWPLSVRFFDSDVFRVWQTWDKQTNKHVRRGIDIVLDPLVDQPHAKSKKKELKLPTVVQPAEPPNAVPKAIERLDFGYSPIKTHLEKSKALLDGKKINCAVCKVKVKQDSTLILVCPHNDCEA